MARILCCCDCGVGSDLTPSLGTSICPRCGPKKKKEKKEKEKEFVISIFTEESTEAQRG